MTPSSRICPRCGALAEAEAAFCKNCGAPLAAQAAPPSSPSPEACSQCGAPLPPGAAFCPQCGAPRAAAQPPSPGPAATQPPTPSPAYQAASEESVPPTVPADLPPEVLQPTPDVCPRCGTPYVPGAAFCNQCGLPQGQAAVAMQVQPTPQGGSASGRFCRQCGHPIGRRQYTCATCGAANPGDDVPVPTPWYAQWWLWVSIALGAVLLIGSIALTSMLTSRIFRRAFQDFGSSYNYPSTQDDWEDYLDGLLQ